MESQVMLVTSDGVELYGTYRKPDGAKLPGAVILLHKFASSKEEFSQLCGELGPEGFATLAIDLRGHGETAKASGRSYRDFSDDDFRAMANDADAAYKKLRQDYPSLPIFIIGASIGANTALNYACSQPAIAGAVLLSPGRLYKGISTTESAGAYGKRPLMLAASSEDQYSYTSTQDLAKMAQGSGAKVELVLLAGAGHGVSMLGFGGLQQKVVQFLKDSL